MSIEEKKEQIRRRIFDSGVKSFYIELTYDSIIREDCIRIVIAESELEAFLKLINREENEHGRKQADASSRITEPDGGGSKG